jgi:hypothetical protein
MTDGERESLLHTLARRFDQHLARHRGISWGMVHASMTKHPTALATLLAMETTGGEPDVIGQNPETGAIWYCDCSAESPRGRRSLCYDQAGLESRKEARPETSAITLANTMGVSLLTEEQYHRLQQLGEFDTKTSSWLATSAPLRALGGALFGDRRYNRVFIYHNGAQSYYAARGFRGLLEVSG